MAEKQTEHTVEHLKGAHSMLLANKGPVGIVYRKQIDRLRKFHRICKKVVNNPTKKNIEELKKLVETIKPGG